MLKPVARCIAIVCACSALPALAACPDYAANPPAFSGPAKKKFSNFGNTILTGLYKPWHMAHDSIVKAGTAASASTRTCTGPA
ncbi:hypothetical protein [Massilia genomosp. 1]|uniref:hypothetical protein n=1 Tax=Massilia genomosp. 1 TaxID=2609280 RepID=UPI001C9E39D7|nr:hypothetical protein [Massilia genomosp. 1]